MKKNATAAVFVLMPVMRGAIGMIDGKAKLLREDYCGRSG